MTRSAVAFGVGAVTRGGVRQRKTWRRLHRAAERRSRHHADESCSVGELATPSPTCLAEASGLLGTCETTLAPKDIDPGGVGHHTLTVHGCELLVELGGALNSSAKAASRRPSPNGCGSM